MEVNKAELFDSRSSTSSVFVDSTKASMGTHPVKASTSAPLVSGRSFTGSAPSDTKINARKGTSFKEIITYLYKGFVGLCCGSVLGGVIGGIIGGTIGLALGMASGGFAVISATIAGVVIGSVVLGSLSGGATCIGNMFLHHLERLQMSCLMEYQGFRS